MLDHLATHLETIQTELTEKGEAKAEETSNSSKTTMEEFTNQQEEIFGELIDKAEELKDAITNLAELVDNTSDTADTAKDTLVDGVELTNVGLGSVLGILDDIKDILGEF